MTELAHSRPAVGGRTRSRIAAAVRTEVGLARLAIATVALHVADDSFLQPNPGTSAADHLAGGLVPLAALAAAAWGYGRVRAGARATIALLAGFLGVLFGTEAVYYTTESGPSGDDFTGLLSVAAGLVLLGLGALTLWRSRKTADRLWWRWTRRGLFAAGAYLLASVVLFPVSIAYVVTHAARAEVPAADLGAPHRDVSFETSDGLTLRGWYVPSRNGAAVISFPGRASSQKRAKLLADHGYGVLVFDRRGEGESDGDPNVYGWQGERDVHAAVAFLQRQPDVDPARIGAIGLSVGGEMLLEAAAESDELKAIVSEGASARSLRDDLANPGGTWQSLVGDGVVTAATTLFASNLPPADLRSLVRRIDQPVLFVYGEHGQVTEEPANRAFHADKRGAKELWEVPGSGHIGGIDAQPAEYERRVVGFFDRTLLGNGG
jgi:dienelactone hydrolase